MMTRAELIEYCLTFPNSYEDYPFGAEWAVMRHSGNKKTFAFIRMRDDKAAIVNLKCEPMEADFLRNLYKDVTPGYHMTNKAGWNTVALDTGSPGGSDVPDDALCDMVDKSYELILELFSKKAQQEILER